MTSKHTRGRDRQAFTLIELLVVMAIIAILIGMTVVGIYRFFIKGDEVKVRDEMGQMATKIGDFKNDRQLPDGHNFPSRLLLKEDGDYVTGVQATDLQLASDSKLFLKHIFPKILDPLNPPNMVKLDWNGNGVIDAGYVILDGSQCLVFFLGGINGNKGFSANPKNPADTSNERIPKMNFDQKRLVDPGNGYPRYNDPWGTPYAYFSSYKVKNGYNRYGKPTQAGATSDCAGLWPYAKAVDANGTPTEYWNPTSFQIISAGPDKKFGPGGLWGPSNIPADTGRDDMANFHNSKLGNP